VELGRADVTDIGPEARARAGIVRTLQRTLVFEDLTVLDHVVAGATAGRASAGAVRSLFATPRSRAETAALRDRAAELLRLAGLEARAADRAGLLDAGDRRLLVVATACASLPSALLLDEPAAGMVGPEVDRLETIVRAIASGGAGVLMVEHDFPLVVRLADRITVLDAGTVLASGPPDEVRSLPEVQEVYFGASV